MQTAQKQTEPIGGQPAPGEKQSVPDLEEQVAYQRAFEAVVWAMSASAINTDGSFEVLLQNTEPGGPIPGNTCAKLDGFADTTDTFDSG